MGLFRKRLQTMVALLAVGLLSGAAQAQIAFAEPAVGAAYATNRFHFEDKDWGVPSSAEPRKPPYHAPTPTTLPSARTILTWQLVELLKSSRDMVVIDVLDSRERLSVPGAYWMPGAGDGGMYAAEKSRFAAALEKLSEGKKDRPLVFLCSGPECWLSYNACLRAVEAGYKDVIWYRGGTDAWRGASQSWSRPKKVEW